MSRSSVLILLAVIAATTLFAYSAFWPGDESPRAAATATAPTSPPPGGELVAKGQQLATQLGCTGCHTVDGTDSVGPTWKGLAGSQVELAEGGTVVADSAYLRESITDPDARIVKGYQGGLMSATVQGQMPTIAEGDNLDALVAYIESLK